MASAVHDLAMGKGFVFRSRGRFRLKGFESSVSAFEVVWQPEPATVPRSAGAR